MSATLRMATVLVAAAASLASSGCQQLPFGRGEDAKPQATPATPAAAAAAPAPAPQAAQAAPPAPAAPPPAPAAFETAVDRAAQRLLENAARTLGAAEGSPPRPLVIDPLIDASTGQQTAGTRQMGSAIEKLVGQRYRMFEVVPFTRTNLEKSPLLLIGTLTAVNAANDPAQRNDVFRIWLTMIDLRTGRVVAKQLDRATGQTVDATPTRFYFESPTWAKDAAVNAYVNSCQVNTKIGDPAQAAYLQSLFTAAELNEATIAYENRRFAEAYKLFRQASAEQPASLRALNGTYLSAWRLRRQREAGDAFARIVDTGLAQKRLPMKFLFVPNTTHFVNVGDTAAQYRLWIRQIGHHVASRDVCLRLVGHTSLTGTPGANEALSLRRASEIRRQVVAAAPRARDKLAVNGRGSAEPLVGLGTDDLRDALDRRVELKVESCPAK